LFRNSKLSQNLRLHLFGFEREICVVLTIIESGRRETVIGFGVVLGALMLQSSSLAQIKTSGAEAEQTVDWTSVKAHSPIPNTLPTGPSDDPLEAGFAAEWIKRSLDYPGNASQRQLALGIVSRHRTANDRWAIGMEEQLREIISTTVQNVAVSRVFCNGIGCLCYVQLDGNRGIPLEVIPELLGPKGRKFGIQRSDLEAVVIGDYPDTPWQLTIVKRPKIPGPAPATNP
jgi:hypothetical protein